MDAVLAIFGVFFAPVILITSIVWFKSRERIKRCQLQADVYIKALESGQPVSPGWFVEPEKKSTSLQSGIICIAVGFGIALTCWFAAIIAGQNLLRGAEDEISAVAMIFKLLSSIGAIPFLIGVAFVIIHFFEKKKDAIKDRIANAQ
jgi:hypothetical protein